jgi:hypothetical protein
MGARWLHARGRAFPPLTDWLLSAGLLAVFEYPAGRGHPDPIFAPSLANDVWALIGAPDGAAPLPGLSRLPAAHSTTAPAGQPR